MKMDENENMETPGTEEFFGRHYIRIDARNRIIRGFSDVPEFNSPPPNEGETDILINGKGGRHFRLILDGEQSHENPWELMFSEQGAPLLKWDAKNKKIARRAEEEIQADIDAIPPRSRPCRWRSRLRSLRKPWATWRKPSASSRELCPRRSGPRSCRRKKPCSGRR